MRTIVRLYRFRKTETTDNVVIDEISCICRSCRSARVDLSPTREGINTNTHVLKSKLISWERTSKINSPMSKNVQNCNRIIRESMRRFCPRKTLTSAALSYMPAHMLFHERKPKPRCQYNQSTFHSAVTDTIVCILQCGFPSSIRICYFSYNWTTLLIKHVIFQETRFGHLDDRFAKSTILVAAVNCAICEILTNLTAGSHDAKIRSRK